MAAALAVLGCVIFVAAQMAWKYGRPQSRTKAWASLVDGGGVAAGQQNGFSPAAMGTGWSALPSGEEWQAVAFGAGVMQGNIYRRQGRLMGGVMTVINGWPVAVLGAYTHNTNTNRQLKTATVWAVPLVRNLPSMYVTRGNRFKKTYRTGDPAFDSAYGVQCDNPQFAAALLNRAVCGFTMATSLEFRVDPRGFLIIWASGVVKDPNELMGRAHVLVQLLSQVPPQFHRL